MSRAGQAVACQNAAMPHPPTPRHLGRVDYLPTWEAMRAFTAKRAADSEDEIWLLEHPPVFTLGMAGKREHLLADVGIPIVPIDRGGQVTYHGPGQIVAYLLLDLRRLGYGVRELVRRIEQAVIDLLADHGVQGERLAGAPGVYVGGAKIAALGLRVKQGCTYHGLALNVDMDLAPYRAINPCGYAGMAVTQLRDLVPDVRQQEVEAALARGLLERIYGG
ncbi:MAG: lipoyl(octanoyl) transferase [bacterium]|nr:MAG: lipoyl(octanoyl) transferase [bacterium]KAF0147400.1 MAG: lipoyl(octanoyl) transferase [bacterium]KAF0167401.1 MAG: lipoyl(octanoyl) transferase [bacterium]TXT16267.1 MAG: lipoyl(octanoyl) transferase [bacterium]